MVLAALDAALMAASRFVGRARLRGNRVSSSDRRDHTPSRERKLPACGSRADDETK
jgi:hypothetical protein